MRLNASAVAAISLMVFGAPDDGPDRERLLHIEVMPLMAEEGCAVTAWLAERYLVPSIPAGDRLAYICHRSVPARELAEMRAEAAAHNARAAARLPPDG